MIITRKILFIPLLAFTLLFVSGGCVKNNSFISGTKLKKELEGTWHLVKLFSTDIPEDWEFAGGALTRKNMTNLQTIDHGNYKVLARIFNSKIDISAMNDTVYNGKWFIVNITKDRLLININYKNCPNGQSHCGALEREFVR